MIASTKSTAWFATACRIKAASAVHRIWSCEVPTTTVGRHAEEVEQGRHDDEAAADAEQRAGEADERARAPRIGMTLA